MEVTAMYEIRNKAGTTLFTAKNRDQVDDYYGIVKERDGYAEVWENRKRIFRTPGYIAHPMKTAIAASVIASVLTYIALRLLLPIG